MHSWPLSRQKKATTERFPSTPSCCSTSGGTVSPKTMPSSREPILAAGQRPGARATRPSDMGRRSAVIIGARVQHDVWRGEEDVSNARHRK